MYTLTNTQTNATTHFHQQLERFDKDFYAQEIATHGIDAVINDDLNNFWNDHIYNTETEAQTASNNNETILAFTLDDLRTAYRQAFC
jgi:hypothetical protein